MFSLGRFQEKKAIGSRIPLRTIYPPSRPPNNEEPSNSRVPSILVRGGSTIAAIKQRLLAQGMIIDSPHSSKPKKSRYASHLNARPFNRHIWQDEKVLRLLFRYLRAKDALNCSLVCKQWRDLLIEDRFQSLQLIIDFKSNSGGDLIEEKLRLAYRWKMTSILLIHMRDDCVQNFLGAYFTTFKEHFPGCPIAAPDLDDEAFKSVPSLLHHGFSSEFHSSCTDSLDCGNLRRLGSAPLNLPMKASRHITKLTFDSCALNDEAMEKILGIMHTVTDLAVVSCNCLSDMALWSSVRPWMTRITVKDCLNLKDATIQAIVQTAPALQQLDLQVYHISDSSLNVFMTRQHINLRVLRLAYGSNLTFVGIANMIHSVTGLQELRLPGCSRLDDNTVELVCEHLPHLQVLEISSNPTVTDSAVELIGASLRHLEELSLDRCRSITDVGLKALSSLSNLFLLTTRWCPELTDECLLYLQPLRKLRILSVAGCKGLTGVGLLTLSSMKNLRRLEITNTNDHRRSKLLLMQNMPKCNIVD